MTRTITITLIIILLCLWAFYTPDTAACEAKTGWSPEQCAVELTN